MAGRLEQVRSCVPGLFGAREVLYVGARPGRAELAAELHAAGAEVDVLEIWPPNVEALRAEPFDWQRWVFEGDVREADLRPWRYNAVVWWHGPEHLPRKEALAAASRLLVVADLVVLGCPWGLYPQGPLGGNPHEVHLWAPELDDFASIGFSVDILPPRGIGGNLLAWKRKRRRA